VPALKAWNASKGQRVTLDDHLNRYGDIYRGYSTFLRVDPATGRMNLKDSFQIELPPYTQDLADAGKGASYGYAFINSYNVEMATGGLAHGKPARGRRVAARLRLPAHRQLEEGRGRARGIGRRALLENDLSLLICADRRHLGNLASVIG
jgi:hypothetical protein